ncbi:MAG: hypothetical protein Q4E67_06250, partial [Planctomycetia bacterium]|nr:hypothetical protein [Planctomycetia bacterium]
LLFQNGTKMGKFFHVHSPLLSVFLLPKEHFFFIIPKTPVQEQGNPFSPASFQKGSVFTNY